MSSSLLKALGHEDWIAEDGKEYVSIVRTLARDVEGRKELRRTQRSRMVMSPLCDANGLARALEEAFEAMYYRWARTSPEIAR